MPEDSELKPVARKLQAEEAQLLLQTCLNRCCLSNTTIYMGGKLSNQEPGSGCLKSCYSPLSHNAGRIKHLLCQHLLEFTLATLVAAGRACSRHKAEVFCAGSSFQCQSVHRLLRNRPNSVCSWHSESRDACKAWGSSARNLILYRG